MEIKPELKQFGDLRSADFDRYPVWIACHTGDFGEPWFDETDEETFRPWTSALPVGPSDGMLFVRAIFVLRDGSHHEGFLTPAFKVGDLGAMQPQIFNRRPEIQILGWYVWVPAISERASTRRSGMPRCYLPIQFSAVPGVASGVVSGRVEGFYCKS